MSEVKRSQSKIEGIAKRNNHSLNNWRRGPYAGSRLTDCRKCGGTVIVYVDGVVSYRTTSVKKSIQKPCTVN